MSIHEQFDREVQEVEYPSGLNIVSRRAYRDRLNDIYAKFHIALSKEYGTELHPKEPILWAKAWDLGHANGLHDVELNYSELSELLV